MLDERCGDILPSDKDVRVVLTELGTPDELAAKYSGEDKQLLISGIYFIKYKRLLKIVLPIVAAAVALGMIIAVISDAPMHPVIFILRLFGQTLGGIFTGVCQAFAIITVIFAVLERTKADIGNDYLSNLPLVPKRDERIKPYESTIGMLWTIVAAVVFLGFPQVIGVWRQSEGWLPIISVEVLRGFWYLIIFWVVLGLVRESVKLIEGRHTKRLAAITIITNIMTIGAIAVIFLNRNILNPDFIQFANDIFTDEGNEFILSVSTHANMIFFSFVSLMLLIEIIGSGFKAWKYCRR
jgi:hypothetical protein